MIARADHASDHGLSLVSTRAIDTTCTTTTTRGNNRPKPYMQLIGRVIVSAI